MTLHDPTLLPGSPPHLVTRASFITKFDTRSPAPQPPSAAPPTTVRHVTDAQPHHVDDESGSAGSSSDETIDLDAVERDLAAVEVALERLNDGTYWTDEVTGEPIPDHVLAADPTARRA